MLRKFKSLIFLSLASLSLISGTAAFAAQGSWFSNFQFDVNGVSGVGTSNSFNEVGHFTFRVIRADGSWIGYSNHTIGPDQSASNSYWGQPALDRQGQVIINNRYWHTPWFNS
ncbi:MULTISPECIES: hypothetical protein [Streptococcus]|uniref:hypothetical protein n=1 Tax=Streptococcus TaxID=1301 RepID=UPI000C1F126B|nr:MULTISPECIES: hypothetical protein [Streptococcus]MBF9683432.1 hypothetical protein [Streptococcus pseudopneumoniae]